MVKRAEGATPVRRLCFDAAALCMVLALSYLETALPLGAWLPVPGVKPGLANIVITLVFLAVSPKDGAAVSVCRVLISGMLFGNPVSVMISLCGATAAYIALCVVYFVPPLKKKLSFIGISVLCAAFHSLGQLCAVSLIILSFGAFSYAAIMLTASCFFGAVNGVILNFLFPSAKKILGDYRSEYEKNKIY